ncbi:MAG: N-acetylneuraminate synthase family protein [Alphaproteobacteria bacterium]|nr:N-acetylneuraminate synthase family protein [Alphaproteobacteria bacterium]
MAERTTFIAEVSSNHSSDLERCLAFIDVAADIGADAAKFQLFRVDEMFAPEILARSERHRARKAWELPPAFLPELAARSRSRGIAFSCTPFYLEAVETLLPHVDFYKVASYELLWDDLLVEVARTGKPLVLSTGMATLAEVLHARDVVVKAGAREVTFLHCVSAYPTPPGDANLAAIRTLREATGFPSGWSDHSVDPAVIHRAVARWGASAVEFHIDLEGAGAEFASGHCWLPGAMRAVIGRLRRGEDFPTSDSCDGTGVKAPTADEVPERVWRADPSDGLRPFRSIRASWRP